MQVREEIAGSLQNAADTCYELDRNMELRSIEKVNSTLKD